MKSQKKGRINSGLLKKKPVANGTELKLMAILQDVGSALPPLHGTSYFAREGKSSKRLAR